MADSIFSTPSRKPSAHDGNAQKKIRKPINLNTESLEPLSRRLFQQYNENINYQQKTIVKHKELR